MKNFKLAYKFRTAVLAGVTAMAALTGCKVTTVLVSGASVDVTIDKNLDYPVEGQWPIWSPRQDSCLRDDSNRVYYQAWLSKLDDAKNLSLLEKVNRVDDLVNNTVKYARDSVIYGVKNYWASGAQTICKGLGDCEDFALAKLYALKYLGVSEDRMSVLDIASHPDAPKKITHAVLAVDTSAANNWADCLILDDNVGQKNSIKRLSQVKDRYHPFYMIGTDKMHHCKVKQKRYLAF
jgi:predicted transglutaminase-like cysteine proteinase